MIAAMNFAVAVGTILRNDGAAAFQVSIVVIQQQTDMCRSATLSLNRMALLAQLGARFVQQRLVIGSMHVVAECAVFGGRLVLPQEGPAFFSMAAVAVFIDCELFQRRRPCRSVGVVAIAANNLVLPDRMPGYTVRLCSDVLMTAVAYLGLRGALGNIMLFMD